MRLEINQNWKFKDVVENLRALRTQYEDILRSFTYFQLNEIVEFKRNTRNAFYSLNFETWKKDKIWNYMNRFEYFFILQEIVKREEGRKKSWK